jgi:hypothetical protein
VSLKEDAMTFQPEDLKYAIPALTPLISSLIEAFVKPKLESIKKHFKGERELLSDPFLTQFERYLARTAKKCSYMTTLVFQNQPKKLEDLYVPLTLTCRGDNNKVFINSYRQELIPKHQKVLMVDAGGMGKSTIAKFLLLSCIKEQKGIPVYIELRRLKANTSILDYICNEIAPIDGEINKDLIFSLIERGDFVFFFDGYDEILSSEVEGVTTNLQDFITKAGNNSFIIASRPNDSVVAFNDFQAFSITPLTEEEAFSLFKLYNPNKEIADSLIRILGKPVYTHVKQFLGNPLLASLLYISFEYQADIPLKKPLFIENIYEALFRRHDLSKGGSYIREKQCRLDIADFHIVLRALAFYSLRDNIEEYDRGTLLDSLRQVKQRLPNINFSEDAFIDDLIKAVPIFTKDGHYYKWTHKSLREHFAAQYICQDAKGNQEKILRFLSNNGKKYYGILEFCADIDYKTFCRTLVYDFVKSYCEYHELSYKGISKDWISIDDLDIRKSLSFIRTPVLVLKNVPVILGYKLKKDISEIREPKWISMQKAYRKFVYSYAPGNNQRGDYVEAVFNGLVIIGNRNTLIYDILSYKQENIFREKKFTRALSLEICIELFLAPLYKEEPLFLDDDPKMPWNSSLNFHDGSVIYKPELSSYRNFKVLDFEKCKELKEKIEQEAQLLSFEEVILGNDF